MGLAYAYNSQYDEAVAQYGKSTEVIEKRMAVLNEQMKEAEGSFTKYEKEIEELKELLREIREKVEDVKESQHSGMCMLRGNRAFLPRQRGFVHHVFCKFWGFFLYNFNKDCRQQLRL